MSRTFSFKKRKEKELEYYKKYSKYKTHTKYIVFTEFCDAYEEFLYDEESKVFTSKADNEELSK